MIICGGHAWDAQKGEEIFLLRAAEVRSQGFGRFETKRLFADILEFFEELFFEPFGCWLGDVAGFEFLTDFACSGAQVLEVASEGIYVLVFCSRWQQRMLPIDFFDVSDAGTDDRPNKTLNISTTFLYGMQTS